MKAGELAQLIGAQVNHPEVEINNVTENSREVKAGSCFAALTGEKVDGEAFIPTAIDNGAVALLVKKGINLSQLSGTMCIFTAKDPRLSFTLMERAFFSKQPENIVAVTGTNGKTSTTVFCRQIWEALGEPAASMGTIGIVSNYMNQEGKLTSPPPTIMYPSINELAEKGVRSLAIEASSHGIYQYRLDGLRIRAAGFTNLTQDHLDYHKTMDNYFMAKLRLFKDLVEPGGVSVINADIAEAAALKATSKGRNLNILSYGFKGKDLRIINTRMDIHGQNLALEILGKHYNIRLPLNGAFQAMNALCALGLCIGTGANIEKAVEALEHLKGAPGRLENVATLANGATIYVDYAHTPDAIEKVLKTLRPTCTGKLSIVMGCGGDRDKTKRPKMGRIAADLADKVFVTDDNPRFEDPAVIRSEVMASCPNAVDASPRDKAITAAIKELQAGDVLVLAGKGHEHGQIIGDEAIPFNDTEEALKAINYLNLKLYDTAIQSEYVIWNSLELCKIVEGISKIADTDIYGISARLEDVKPADVFIALEPENENDKDGHDDVDKALKLGAIAAIVHRSGQKNTKQDQLIVVNDTTNALDEMAKYARFRNGAKLLMMFKNSANERLIKALKTIWSTQGKVAAIYDRQISPIDAKISLCNVCRETKFILLTLGAVNTAKLADVSKAVYPDVILVTSEDRAVNVTDIFKGAMPGAILLIEDNHRDRDNIVKEAKINGIHKILSFGLMENSDISANKFGEDRLELMMAALDSVLS